MLVIIGLVSFVIAGTFFALWLDKQPWFRDLDDLYSYIWWTGPIGLLPDFRRKRSPVVVDDATRPEHWANWQG